MDADCELGLLLYASMEGRCCEFESCCLCLTDEERKRVRIGLTLPQVPPGVLQSFTPALSFWTTFGAGSRRIIPYGRQLQAQEELRTKVLQSFTPGPPAGINMNPKSD